MTRGPKWKVIIVLAVVGLVGFLAVLGYFAYRVSDVKGPLISTLQSQINGKLEIGRAQVMFFPTGINLKDIRLYAPGEKEPSASVKEAKLRFKLIPLIQKKIETSLTLVAPEIHLRRKVRGPNNMEKIFAPLLAGETQKPTGRIDQIWWKRIAINRLNIKNAYFKSTQEGRKEVTELKHLSVVADDIRFESGKRPADISIQYDLPAYSKVPMKFNTKMIFEEKDQSLGLEKGEFRWGSAVIQFGGVAFLPHAERKEVALNFNFSGRDLPLKKISQNLKDPLPLGGSVSLRGTITGSPFAPVLTLILESPFLALKELSLKKLHAELKKSGKPIQIKNTQFELYEGKVEMGGQVVADQKTSADFKVSLRSLNVGAMSGNSDSPTRLHGHLKIKTPNLKNMNAFSGNGNITVGPIPIPPKNLKEKIRVAELLSVGTGLDRMVNVGLLSNSANVVGTRIEELKARVELVKGDLRLAPFSMANQHFSSTGNAVIQQQQTIQGQGSFVLSQEVTRQLITDELLRQSMTQGSGKLTVPYQISGPLKDPEVRVDHPYLQGQVAKAALVVMQRQALGGGVQPQRLLDKVFGAPPPTQNQQEPKKKSPLDPFIFGR